LIVISLGSIELVLEFHEILLGITESFISSISSIFSLLQESLVPFGFDGVESGLGIIPGGFGGGELCSKFLFFLG